MMMSAICLIEKGNEELMDPQNHLFGETNDNFSMTSSYDDGFVGSNDVNKLNTIETNPFGDGKMIESHDTQEGSGLNSSKCVEKLIDERNAQNIQDSWCSELDRQENFGMISSKRASLKDHLNVNASYSYRTHFFLNR